LRNKDIQGDAPDLDRYRHCINVKQALNSFYKAKTKGMLGMLEYLGIERKGRHHSGIDDTRNIAAVLEHMFQDGFSYRHFYIQHV